MSAGSYSANRRLAISLPFVIANGVTIGLKSNYRFQVSLVAENIDRCILNVNSEADLFKEDSQEIEIEFTEKIEERSINVTLTPLSQTAKPTWIAITARADELVQAGGFFVTIE